MNLPEKNRLEAFSDGVFAILITLLVLEIRVPHFESLYNSEILDSLKELSSKFIAFFVSFIVIAVYWVSHHSMFAKLKFVSGVILWFNLLVLLLICLIPFTSALIGDYPNVSIVLFIYALHISVVGILYTILDRMIFNSKKLHASTISTEYNYKRHILGNVLNLSACILSFLWIPGVIALLSSRIVFIISQLRVAKS